jgi:regulator of replication initiation timing
MDKKKVMVIEYNNHPEMEGDELKVVIMNNEKIKPKMKKPIAPRKPKQPRITIDQLAKIVLDGFAAINQRIDKIEETLKRHEEILMRHEEIFKRNNLK